MVPIAKLRNPIRHYSWGSRTAMATLLRTPLPSPRPEAELWMGAHPSAPSTVELDPPQSLLELIRQHPAQILGKAVSQRHDGELPFLFKLLAAAAPLSLQVHPDRRQARAGFDREEASGLERDNPRRNYRDPNPKPEILCALTPFWALHGFRPADEVEGLLRQVAPRSLEHELDILARAAEGRGLRELFAALLKLSPGRRERILGETRVYAQALGEQSPFDWVRRLLDLYPGDVGVLAPLVLNLVRLEAGQALFTGAGVVHGYLEGFGVELMASSDNVVRVGLTSKHVDQEELLRIADFRPQRVEILEAHRVASAEAVFPSTAAEFRLSVIDLRSGSRFTSPERRNVEILLCTEGEGVLSAPGCAHPLRPGTSLLVPADGPAYTVAGQLRLFKATVPLP